MADLSGWEEERALLIAEARAARAAGDQAGRERDDAVAAHRASEEAYRHLTEALPQIVWITRPDGSHVYFNQRWIDYTGLNLEESCGFGWDKLLHPDDRQRRQDRWDEASRTGEAYEIEYRFQGADGGYRWFLGRAMPLRDAQGKIINWLGTCTDIDAQKRAAEALRESQESLNLALGAVHIGTWVWHVQENALRWDERMHDIFGLPRGTFSGTYEAFLSRIHPDDVWHITDKVSRTLAENTSFDIDYRVVWPDGSVHFLTARAAVFRDGSGRPLRMTGMCLDITERKRVEEELVYERYLLHSLMDTIPDSIYFKDRESRFLRVNRSLAERFGFDDPASALGKSDLDLFTEEHARPAYQDEQAIIGTGQPIIGKEEKETWPDGRVTWVSTTKMPLRGADGSIIGTLGISRDITDRKQTEEELYRAKEAAEAANRAKSDFLANMSHEIRTPMNGIIGMTELALTTQLTGEQREFLALVKTSADALLDVINDILDFSKIEARKLQLESVDFSLADTVADVLRGVVLRAEQKNLELACQIPPELPEVLEGDPGRLRQILLNLVGNAIKFTDTGEVVIRVELESHSTDTIYLHFAVADTGAGIATEKQAMIFEAFTQADSSTTRKYGGSGLGLAICSQLVDMMHGRIWVESRLGRGSTFHFTACFGLSKNALPAAKRLPPTCLRGLAVLVVDDNATNRRILQEILLHWGMHPTVVEDAGSAITAMCLAARAGAPFALVLLDAMMPEKDGFTLAAEIRDHPELGGSLVMMLSSVGRPEVTRRCRDLGISTYLTKPIKQAELMEAILASLIPPPPPAQGEASESSMSAGNLEILKVLLAEDNPVNQHLARCLLERQGHSVAIVPDGRKALALLERESFDLVLMDVQMPELDGLETTKAIREGEKVSGKHLPIVAMTAHAMKGDRERCLAAGMDGYVSKPVQEKELWQAIARAVPARDGHAGNLAPLRSVPGNIDWQPGLDRVGGDLGLLRDLARVFLGDSPRILNDIRAAIGQGDARKLKLSAHAMKGAVSIFSVSATSEAALQLESLGRHGKMEDASAMLTILETELDRLTGELDALVAGTKKD